ncbi:MAG: family 78 glycoside hydrolase catalytic domain [Candidatus Hodarchaeota archaeon]
MASDKGKRKRRLVQRRKSREKKGESIRAPLFRHEFTISDAVKSAMMNICGLGYYEAWINQERVGDHVLDPAQSDYEQRVFYVSHDVTPLVHSGKNCIAVMLGNGWYNQDRVWGRHGLSYGEPRLACELHVTLADGNVVVIGSNESWTWAPGPVTDDNIYAGERYDARLELPGWDAPGFDDSSWLHAVIVSKPLGKLMLQEMPPIRKIEVLNPITITPMAGGRYVVDMGQNFSGWARIRLETDAGREITLRFAETISGDGNIDTASTGVFATKVEQIDSYITKGGRMETWEPRFTYHGFRYVEVSGWPGDLSDESISGIVIHTDLPIAGGFECSDKRLNQLHRMALWTHRSNIHSIPEDCPARERCGWLGDANMVAEFSMWNFQGKSFWEKYLGDIETTRATNNGIPASIAPGKRGTRGPANPDWAAAFIMLPWYIHVQYGDPMVLDYHWRGMEQLMEYYNKEASNWILRKGYGDWFDPGAPVICTNTPPSLTSTFWFYRCAQIMSSAASVLNKPEKAECYASWAAQIKDSVISEYFDHDEGSFESQTANAMALAFGIVPTGEESRVLDALIADIRNNDTHLSTGIMGVRFLFEVLTHHGHGNLALALMHQDTYPSFGYLISRGATTLWEHWGEEEHDIHHGPRSLNHPMMGGFDNWFYNTLAGIRADPKQPGFKHFFLIPHPIIGLNWVRCHYECPFGRIESNWELKNEVFEWTVVVPQGTRATVTFPFSQKVQKIESGRHKLADREISS